MRDLRAMCRKLAENEYIGRAAEIEHSGTRERRRHACGSTSPRRVFYGIVGEQTGIQVRDAADLIAVLDDFAGVSSGSMSACAARSIRSTRPDTASSCRRSKS